MPPQERRWQADNVALLFKMTLVIVLLMGSFLVALFFFPKVKETFRDAWGKIKGVEHVFEVQFSQWFVPRVNMEKIHIGGTQYVAAETYRDYLMTWIDTAPINEISLSAIQQHVLSHPWIVDALVMRFHNGEIYVQVTEHEPIAVYADQQGRLMLVNEAGQRFVEISLAQLSNFSTLWRLTGFLTPESLEQLLYAKHQLPEAFTHLVRADRLQFQGWKFWYRREHEDALFYIYLNAKNTESLLLSLRRYLSLEARFRLSERAVQGYDLRALPHLRVDFSPKESPRFVQNQTK